MTDRHALLRPALGAAAIAVLALSAAFVSPAHAQGVITQLGGGAGRGNQDGAGGSASTPARVPIYAAHPAARPAPTRIERWSEAPFRAQFATTVTTAADSGAGSLRSAIAAANASGVPSAISFGIGSGVQTIALTTALPTIVVPIDINGTTQPGYAGTPLIFISGTSAGTNVNGLTLHGGNSHVHGLAIGNFASTGTNGIAILLEVAGGNVIDGNFLGTDPTGTLLKTNGSDDVVIRGGSGGNLIGGTTAAARNLLDGTLQGAIAIAIDAGPGNVVRGNWIGLASTGASAVPNAGNGIFIDSSDDTIGGTVAGARNVISGCSLPAVFIGMDAQRVVVQGNWIGTDATGSFAVTNSQNGIYMDRSPNNTIGSTNPLGRNVVGANLFPGVYAFGAAASGNTIIGNYIGTDATGTHALSGGNGVIVDGTTNTHIGSTAAGGGNVISGNPSPAVDFIDGASHNTVVGNIIGLDPTGTIAVPNSKAVLVNNSPNNVIGGTTAAERNIISASTSYGIEIRSAGASGTKITGNYIGTDITGTLGRGNGQHGIIVGSSQDTIGDLAAGAGNRIAFNKGCGIYDSTGTGVRILSNDMSDNTGLGIDLFPRGITPNDSLDVDSGANGLQNFPVVDSIQTIGSSTKLHWTMQSKPSQPYTVQFFRSDSCNASHFGEGRTLIGTLNFTSSASGADSLYFTSPTVWPVTQFVTATATDAAGNTSEYSPCTCMNDADGDGILDTWETQGWGIDVNHDGKIDLDLYARGARTNHKDVFVEIDAMSSYAPPDVALQHVVSAYAAAPAALVHNPDGLPGVALHYTLDDTTITISPMNDWHADLAPIKKQFFGTQTERTDPNAVNILAAKRLVYRYGLWARTFVSSNGDTTGSGVAELTNGLGGDDFLVTLGSMDPANGWNHSRDPDDHAGTFMHELGHTLGLFHGGSDSLQYKPNYISVMNYTWQTPRNWQVPGTWTLDYSIDSLPPLDEGDLNETLSLEPTIGKYPALKFTPFCDSTDHVRQASLVAGSGVDWSGDGVIASRHVVSDVNNILLNPTTAGLGDYLKGFEDWSHLKYNFRNSPAFTGLGVASNGASDASLIELTPKTDHLLDQIPPPKPKGHFVMDGKLDSIATPLATNAGITLYACYRGDQVYLATQSAQALGADMCIFISNSRRGLHAAPLGKTGQVGDWSAVLTNRATDNSSDWFDDGATSLYSMTSDSAGTVLEGVVPVPLLFGSTPTHLYIAVGKYSSSAGGALLAQVPAGNGDGNIDGAEYFDWATTLGVPRGELAGTGGGVRLANVGAQPTSGRAELRLTMPRDGNANVSVLDMQGRRVATLLRGRVAAGVHDLVWDPGANGGRRAAAGVYFVVANALGEERGVRVVVR